MPRDRRLQERCRPCTVRQEERSGVHPRDTGQWSADPVFVRAASSCVEVGRQKEIEPRRVPESLTCQWLCTEALARRRRLQRKISGRNQRPNDEKLLWKQKPLASSSTVIVRPDDGPVAREASAPTISDTNGPKQQNVQERLQLKHLRKRVLMVLWYIL